MMQKSPIHLALPLVFSSALCLTACNDSSSDTSTAPIETPPLSSFVSKYTSTLMIEYPTGQKESVKSKSNEKTQEASPYTIITRFDGNAQLNLEFQLEDANKALSVSYDPATKKIRSINIVKGRLEEHITPFITAYCFNSTAPLSFSDDCKNVTIDYDEVSGHVSLSFNNTELKGINTQPPQPYPNIIKLNGF